MSAFSPEDLYSNLLGIQLASFLILSGEAESEDGFNNGMDRAIRDVLRRLGATPPDVTRRALDAVDGLWWNSQERLPSAKLVIRRNLDAGPELVPWRIPPSLVVGELAKDTERHCAHLAESPAVLRHADRVEGLPFERIAKLNLWIDDPLASAMPLPSSSSRWLNQRDLAAIVKHRVRAENESEFGPGHDRPGNRVDRP